MRRQKAKGKRQKAKVPHYRTRERFVEISQANVGLIRRDLLDLDGARERLAEYSTVALLKICEDAAELFLHSALPLGNSTQRAMAS